MLKGSIAQLRHYVQPEQILISTLIQKPIARELLCDKGLLFRSLTRASPVLKEGDPISTGRPEAIAVMNGFLSKGAHVCFAFIFLNRIKPNSPAFFFVGPTWRPSDFAISSALTFFLANALS